MKSLYIDSAPDAKFLILNKIRERKSAGPTSKTKDHTGKIIDERYDIANLINFNNHTVLINHNTFYQAIAELKKNSVISFSEDDLYFYDIIALGVIEGCESYDHKYCKKVVSDLIKMGRTYPGAPEDEVLQEVGVYFKIILDSLEEAITKSKEDLTSRAKKDLLLVVEGVEKHRYYVEYNRKREIKVNGVLLAKPDFGSQNYQAFEYIFNHPNIAIKKKDIQEIEKEFKKDLTKVIADLGFKRELKELFFPDSSKNALRFVNPITTDHLDLPEFSHLNDLDLEKLIKSIKPRKK